MVHFHLTTCSRGPSFARLGFYFSWYNLGWFIFHGQGSWFVHKEALMMGLHRGLGQTPHPPLCIMKSSRFGYMLSSEAVKVTSIGFFVEFRVATFR